MAKEKDHIYIHKRKSPRFEIVGETLCGKEKIYSSMAQLWKKVTCKECLKFKDIPRYHRWIKK